jgi:hypothetical protein
MFLNLASSISFILLLLGGFMIAIGYGMVSDCLTKSINSPCWDPRNAGIFYAGAAVAILGATLLVGPDVIKLFQKKGARGDSELYTRPYSMLIMTGFWPNRW